MALFPTLPGRGRKPQIAEGGLITVESLDEMLAVESRLFGSAVKRLAKQVRNRRAQVDVQGYRDRVAVPVNLSHARRERDFPVRFLAEYPILDRAGEQRMARRLEFLVEVAVAQMASLKVPAALRRDLAFGPIEGALAQVRKPARSTAKVAAKHADEVDYLRRCIEQVHELRNLFVEAARPMIYRVVGRYTAHGVEQADMLQEAIGGLFEAVKRFDWRREIRFQTYAENWIREAVLDLLYKSARTVRLPHYMQKLQAKVRRELTANGNGPAPGAGEIAARVGVTAEQVERAIQHQRSTVSLDAPLGDDEGGTLADGLADLRQVAVGGALDTSDRSAVLQRAMSALPERERLVIERRFGLNGHAAATLADIGDDLGVSAERVRQIEEQAKQRLRRSPLRLAQLVSA